MEVISNEIIVALVRILGAALSVVSIYLLNKLRKYLSTKMGQEDLEFMDKLIHDFVLSAEQTLKMDDPDGTKRLEYVKSNLIKLGYDVSEVVLAKIEASVLKINRGEYK